MRFWSSVPPVIALFVWSEMAHAQTTWPPPDVRPTLTSLSTVPADVVIGEPIIFEAKATTCSQRKDQYCVPLTDSRCNKFCNGRPPEDSQACPTPPNDYCFDGRCVDRSVELRYCSSDCVVDPCAPKGSAYDPGDGTCPATNPFCRDFGTSHTYRNVGPYTARARGWNDAGTSVAIELVVNPRETRPPVADFTWNNLLPAVPEIAGNAIPFKSDGLTTNGVRQYLWDFGDGTTSTDANPSHAFAAADTYVVTLTVTNNIGRSTKQKEISIGAKSGGTPPEAANFTFSPALAVTGQTVRFTDKSTGRILRWRWMFETTLGDTSLIDKALSYVRNPTHVYNTPQRKNVELWVSNEYGRKGILLFVDVLRSDSPPIAAFSFSPVTVTVGVPVQFTDESGGPTSWLWDFGEDGATSTQQNPRHTYQTSGQKAVTLRVTNAYGTNSTTKYFACGPGEPARLEALFTWTPTIPRPFEEVRFVDQSTGSPERWSWTVSDGTTSNERNWTHRFVRDGDYIVGLRVDKGSSTHQLGQLIRVRSGPAPVARFNWTPVSPDPGQEVRFENESQNATAFAWNFGDGSTSTERNPAHSYRDARTYTIRLAAKNAEGDEHTATKSIIVGGPQERPVALFDVTPNPAKAGRPVQFTDRSTGRPTRWYWTFGHSGATSNLQNPTYTFTATGTYTVTLVAENSIGRSEERGIGVVVRTAAKPLARFTWTPREPKTGQTVVFTDESENDPTDWQWTFPGGVTRTGRQVSHIFTERGRFDVTLRASNDEGSDSLTQQVPVSEDLLVDFTIEPESPLVGKKTRFTDTTRGSFDSREWIVDGLVRERGAVLEYIFASDGLHTVELRVMRGTELFQVQKLFEVAGPPLAVIRYDGELVAGREVTFNSGTKGVVTKYEWTINGQPAGTEKFARTTFGGAGKVRVTLRVENAAGSNSHTITPDVKNRPATERPNITKYEHVRYGPCMFEDRKGLAPTAQDYDVKVAWKTFNPSSIVAILDGDDVRRFTTLASGETTRVRVPMAFPATVKPLETHTISFEAIGTRPGTLPGPATESSLPETKTLTVFRVPDEMLGNAFGKLDEDRRITYTYQSAIPAREIELVVQIPRGTPLFGGHPFGITKTQWRQSNVFRTDCTSESGTEAEGGITMAGGTISFKGYGKGGYEISRSAGIRVKQGSAVGWELKGTIERTQNLGDLLGPGSALCSNTYIGSVCKVAELKASIFLSGGGEWTYAPNVKTGGVDFSDNTGVVKLGGGLGGKVNAGALFELEVGATLTGSLTVGAPSTDKGYLRKADLVLEGSAKLATYVLSGEYKYAFGCTYPATDPGDLITCGKNAGDARAPRTDMAVLPLSVIPVYEAAEKIVPTNQSGTAIEDVSPLADPAAAFRDDKTLVVYLTENSSVANSLHRLDVRYVRRDSTDATWSQPKAITSDALGEFNPAVLFRGVNEAVAIWERNRNGNLTPSEIATFDDLPKLMREMEIVAATYDAASDRWSAAEALTTNDVYDFAPRLAVLSDGRVVAVWIRQGSDGVQQIVSRTLTATSWSAETVMATGLRGLTDVAITSRGSEAHLVFSHDKDGSSATVADTEIGVVRFRDGVWQRLADLTSDTSSDTAVQIVYAGDTPRAIWLRDKDLVWRRVAEGDIEMIRPADPSLGLLSATAIVSTSGRVAIVRPDLFGSSNAAVAQLWDPATNHWTPDISLRQSTGQGQNVMPSFSGTDTIRLVMLDTVPRTGTTARTDLIAADKLLRVDVAAVIASVTSAPQQPQTGERVTLSATVENRGQIAVRDVAVHLFAGNSATGSPLAAKTIAGTWDPGEKKRVELTFDYASSASLVTLVVDPAMTLGDANTADNTIRHSFQNRAPVACFQASALSGAAPLDLSLDASCSRDTDGSLVSYSWNIGSGEATSASSTASHRFTTSGTYPVTLVVIDDMGARSSRTVTVEVSGTDRRVAATTHSLYLSVAGRAQGVAGSYFVSDVDILNTDAEELEIDAVFVPSGRGDTFSQKLTLGGGELLRTRDVLAQMFSAANGTGSIRLDLSHPHAVAAARTYNDQPSGTAGFSNAAVRYGEALGDGESGVILQQWLPGYRTNIGFTEVGGQFAEVTAVAYDGSGAKLGEQVFGVGAYQHQQVNGVALFQNRGRIELTVRGGRVLAYASTIDGKTNDPIYQVAERRRTSTAATTLLVPVVARLAGANNSTWRSDVRVFNPSAAQQSVTLTLRTAAGLFTKTAELAAGQTAAYDDVIAVLFPQLSGNVGGGLTITGTGPLMASSRTFNLTAGGTYGLYIPARDTAELLGAGEIAYLTQIQENDAYRCNLGMTAAGGGGRLEVRAFDSRGETLATKEYGVGDGQNMQIGRVLADMGVPLPIDVAGLEVRVIEGQMFVYASVNDNRTGDGTFVEASR